MSEWKITKEGLRNEAGVTVQFVDRSKVLYVEGPRRLTVEVEYLSAKTIFVYLMDVTHWDAPHNQDIITPELNQHIRQNLRDAFLFEKLKTEFDD